MSTSVLSKQQFDPHQMFEESKKFTPEQIKGAADRMTAEADKRLKNQPPPHIPEPMPNPPMPEPPPNYQFPPEIAARPSLHEYQASAIKELHPELSDEDALARAKKGAHK